MSRSSPRRKRASDADPAPERRFALTVRPESPDPIPLGLIDAHAHSWSSEFEDDRAFALERAWDAGLEGVVEVGVDLETSQIAHDLAARDARVHAAGGLHPHEASRLPELAGGLRDLLAAGGFVAVGEIGLDLYRNLSPPAEQHSAFLAQLDLARELQLPVVVHSRDADEETFDVLNAWSDRVGRYLGPEREIGMMHCFAGDLDLAHRYLELGWLISVPGTVTYPNNHRGQAVAAGIPLDGMLLETDCPYLTPVPYRGKRNEPAFLVETARFVAELRGCGPGTIAQETSANARRLFGLPS